MKWAATLFFLFSICLLHSQNENTKWFFGYHCGLDFSTSPPTFIPSPSFKSTEGGASISDAAGNLLFYTDGVTVWNKSHAVMTNGTGLFGNQTTTQSSIIVRQPGSNSIFIVFTEDSDLGVNGLCYSIVDMSLSGGMGAVTIKNTLLFTPSCEKLAAITHCNGSDVWVITHDYNSNTFRNYLVTAAGVSPTPVISTIGPNITTGNLGMLKVSPTGRKIAMPFFLVEGIHLFDFNPSTGMLSNHIVLNNDISSYGCEFSPDGSKLYAGPDNIYQWDLCGSDLQAIQNSSFTVFTNLFISIGAMQLAPDGKIYISTLFQNTIPVIHAPNLAGAACNFNPAGPSVGTGTAMLGLPNFVVNLQRPPFTFTHVCSSFSFATQASTTCPKAQSFSDLSWDFGDPSSGSQNTSTLAQATHSFSSPGAYTVKLLFNSACGPDTLKQVLTTAPLISVTGTSSLCAGESATLQASGADSYTWQPGGQATSSLSVSPPESITYSVAGTVNGCKTVGSGSILVIPRSYPLTGFSFPTPVCVASSDLSPTLVQDFSLGGLFIAADSVSVDPVTGSVDLTKSIYGVHTVTYSIASKNCMAAGSATAALVFAQPPQLSAHSPVTLAPGTNATLEVKGGSSYTWTAGNLSCATCASPVIALLESGRYCVASDNQGCKSELCIDVLVSCETGDLSLPSAFTPNGDGNNDQFCIQGWDVCIKEFSVFIFNRWGETVFRSHDPRFCWNGSHNNQPLDPDVFVYFIQASFSNGTTCNKKGNISLLR